MEKFQIIAPATFPAGARLGLSKAQAGARANALKAVGKGVFVAVLPVQFKAGETVAYDGELPKDMAESLIQAKPKATPEQAPVADAPAAEPVEVETAGE